MSIGRAGKDIMSLSENVVIQSYALVFVLSKETNILLSDSFLVLHMSFPKYT
jgi:hypothetical protein